MDNNTWTVKKNIGGCKIQMEVCDEGEFTTVNPECYNNLTGSKKYSIRDMLLFLLGVDREVPLKKILLVREAFVFEKELVYDLNLSFEPLKFKPYKYGPNSRLLDDYREEYEKFDIFLYEQEDYFCTEIFDHDSKYCDAIDKVTNILG